MKIDKVKLVYFSPTGTTQKVLQGIAEGITNADVEHVDLTLPLDAKPTAPISKGELIIMGAPVYGGRLPTEAITRLKKIKADKALVVLIVLYGNREFEDALIELKNFALEMDLIPVAGGAFIGEHSFSTDELPIASGRPDATDIQLAKEFGSKIQQKIDALGSAEDVTELTLPGSFPYEAGGVRPLQASPVTVDERCTTCGICATVCPTEAITIDEHVTTDVNLCIRCCACIKSCPEQARIIEAEAWIKVAHWLHENCDKRKEPQFFGVPA